MDWRLAAWWIASGLVCGLTACGAPAPLERPNIVFLLADDLGWQDTSVPFGGEPAPQHAHFRTPHLAALAGRGVRFSQAYAHAVCSPTRTSLMTGKNPARHGVTQWTLEPGRDPSPQRGRAASPPDWCVDGLQPDAMTLPRLLREAGYITIHAGKAHWGARGTPGEDPCALGFDVNIAGHAAGAPGSYSARDAFGAAKPRWAVPGLEDYHGRDVHLTEVITDEALRAVDTAVQAGAPFYLYLAHYAVHTPIQPHEPYASRYRAAGVDAIEAAYASMVEGVDASLGRVLARLQELGVAENTIVMFASDNGGLAAHARGAVRPGIDDPHGYNWPLRAGKASCYEGGTRIPQVVAWASPASTPLQHAIRIPPDSVSDAQTIAEDWFPTILHWAGVAYAADIDGVDFTPALRGEPIADADRALVFHYPHHWGPRGDGYEPHTSIRLGDHKAIWFYEDARWELYDLARDPSEQHDLATSDPDRLHSLAARLRAELEARNAQFPVDREAGSQLLPEWPR